MDTKDASALAKFIDITKDSTLSQEDRRLISHILTNPNTNKTIHPLLVGLIDTAYHYKTQTESLSRKIALEKSARNKDRKIILYLTISIIVFGLLIFLF